jgi:alkylation response protein AidB-like acyl-CoA dehydrogenase
MANKIFSGGEYLLKEVTCKELYIPEDFSDEHKQIAETTEQFVLNEIHPVNDQIEQKNFDLVVSNLKKCGELGLLMIDAPEEHGGLELDKVTSMLVAEKFGASGNFGLAYLCQTGIGMLPLIYYGNDEQKERYLDKLMSGEMIASYCLTEPGSGSDALGAKSTAILSEDNTYYTLNGTKQFITNAGFADFFTIFAKVDKEHFSGFLVERTFPGLEIGPEEKKLGLHGSSTCQVIMNDVKVPVENLLGEVGKGHKIAFNVLNVGRFKLGAVCVGQKKYAISEAARYANDRKQFNLPISSFGAIREKFADVTAMTFASESMVYRLAGLIDDRISTIDKGVGDYLDEYQKGIEEYAAECAIIKVFCSEAAAKTIDEMLQVHGGYGFIAEYPIEQLYRDERVQRIYEGTNEINRMLIPGIFFRKGITGDKAEFSSNTTGEGTFSPEKILLKGLKSIYLRLSSLAAKKFGANVAQEQEILLALADVAIQVFALESALLRAEKAHATAGETKKKLLEAVVKVFAFSSRSNLVSAAERCAVFLEDNGAMPLLIEIEEIVRYDVGGLLAAKRILADATSEAEKYIF